MKRRPARHSRRREAQILRDYQRVVDTVEDSPLPLPEEDAILSLPSKEVFEDKDDRKQQ